MNIKQDLPEDFRCPLCLDHMDYDFVWYELAETYLCLGCRCEIDQGLDFDHQPTADDYNCANTIEKLLVRLGISYAELRQRQRRLRASQ